ncbi:hypothetical protein [Lentibacillus sp.]|uniref:hypothetical protein n=1 Tax=Lentibacillus sp. TaxID=1925746 RepID=UPI002B4ABEC5|nr:hypothetical protein [Lentibacillus sp.]HLS08866.1 hypothetical protein [Lentibacillus sp.]
METEQEKTIIVTHGHLMALLINHFQNESGFEQWRNLTNPDVYLVCYENNEAKIEHYRAFLWKRSYFIGKRRLKMLKRLLFWGSSAAYINQKSNISTKENIFQPNNKFINRKPGISTESQQDFGRQPRSITNLPQ